MMYIPSIKRAQELNNLEFQALSVYPKDFKPTDKERIRIFSERLSRIRDKYYMRQRADKDGNNIGRAQQDLANALEISKAMVSKYESGKICSIPMNHLRKICEFYDVTPHYLFGYVEDEDKIVSIDENGEIERDESGNPKELRIGMVFEPNELIVGSDTFKNLYYANLELFRLMTKVSSANPDIHKKAIISLSKLFPDS